MDWANANTYAPWQTPNQNQGNPSFGGYGAETSQQTGGQAFTNPLVSGLAGGFLGMFMNSKKRASPDYYAPSYQGSLFTPEEGMPSWYTDGDPMTSMYSPEGTAANSYLQTSMMPTLPTNNPASNPSPLNSGYSMPWLGQNGYAPAYGNSYNGYTGSSGSNNTFVPTGGIGQY